MIKNMSNPHILLVEDEDLIIDLLRDYLKDFGYGITAVNSTEEAIEKLNNGHQFNLVITDINLPGKSGLELLKIIKQTKSDLPVILLTGQRTLDFAISALKSGAQEYITKPFELADVKKIVDKILRRQRKSIKQNKFYENLNYLQMKFEFESSEIDPDVVSHELATLLQKMNFASENEVSQYELVFNETLINSLEHGNLELPSSMKKDDLVGLTEYERLKEERLCNPTYARRKIRLAFECNSEVFSLTVQDEGPGFDWKKIVDPSFKVSDQTNDKAYGRGFMIIKHLIDEVHFNQKGNIITLIKQRPS